MPGQSTRLRPRRAAPNLRRSFMFMLLPRRRGRSRAHRSQPDDVGPQLRNVTGLEMFLVGGHLENGASQKVSGQRIGLEAQAHATVHPLAELDAVTDELGEVAAVP